MPPPPPPQSSDAEIDALEAVCERLAGFRRGVTLEWVDGFMTALLAGPRAVPPSEWLPAMFGDDFERTFADPEDLQQAMSALLARWNVLARQLDAQALLDDPDALRLSPLLVDYDGAVRAEIEAEGGDDAAAQIAALPRTGQPWAQGFLDALEAFPQDWPQPDAQSDDGRFYGECLQGVAALTLEGDALEAWLAEHQPGRTLSRDDLVDEACWCVQDLRAYWVDHAPTHAPIRVDPKPGRNDPCPCGSGRKYKKCCGA